MSENVLVLEQVAELALRLSPVDRVRLIERLMPLVERDMVQAWEIERDSLIIEQARAEASEFVTLDEMLAEYTRETGYDLAEGGHEL